MAGPIFQNLSDFIADPFGRGSADVPREWITKSDTYILQKKIRMMKILTYDDCYSYNVEVPSESNPSVHYDVVIQFIPPNKQMVDKKNVPNYYVKFFSNSPSFIYQYAVLYKVNGFLIDFLYDKMDQAYIDKEPQKPKKLMYDKSIYAACQYLLTGTTAALSKLGLVTRKKKTKERFFKDIKTFEDVKLTGELNTLDKKIDKELEENKKIRKDARNKHRSLDKHRKNAKKDTMTGNIMKHTKKKTQKGIENTGKTTRKK